ncbi:MAG: hypothetical protein ACK5WD_13635 [bacterium]|jgi:hypothetical protein
MTLAFEPTALSAWIEQGRLTRATRILSDPRLSVKLVGSDDPRTRRALAERFGVEAFDDLRRLAVATDGVLWIDRSTPLGEAEREMLAEEDIAIVAGAGTLEFLLAVPQCETAPSFRRMAVGRTLLGIVEVFGRVEVFQSTVAVPDETHLAEGLRLAAASALAVLGPIDQVTALGARAGTITASVIGDRGFGTLAVGIGCDACSFTLVGEGGIATVTPGVVAWRRRDGAWLDSASSDEPHFERDGDEPVIQTIREADKPSAGARLAGDANRRMRLRIAALADTVRLSARTGHSESVEAMLRSFGVDPIDLLPSS